MTPALGVGLIGYAFMGAAHSQAWRTAPHFFDLPLHPRLTVLAGRDANPVADAAAMTEAAVKAAARGVRSMVGFTYRRVPAIGLARTLVADGRLGDIRHVRAQYLQDWIADPAAPMSWRLEKDKAGSGALGDIGAHIVDLTQFITGQTLTGVSGLLETFVKERPLPTETGKLGGVGGEGTGTVTVDDAA